MSSFCTKFLYIVILFTVVLFNPLVSTGQVLTVKGSTTLSVKQNATLFVNGSILIENNATIVDSNGTIRFTGDFTNNGSFTGVLDSLVSVGTTSQVISGSGFTNTSNLVSLTASTFQLVIDKNISVDSNLVAKSGSIVYENATADRTITLNGSLTVDAGATFGTQTGTVRNHRLNVRRNIVNNGTINTNNISLATIRFIGAGTSIYSGSTITNSLSLIEIRKASINDSVLFTFGGITAPASGFLSLDTGTVAFNGTFALSNQVFLSAGYTISATAGLVLNNPNVTILGQNGTPSLAGRLNIQQGTFNVGTGSNQNHFEYENNAVFNQSGGTVNIIGRFSRGSSSANIINFTQTGGNFSVGTGVVSSSTTKPLFDIGASGSTFNRSGGVIILQRGSDATPANGGDYFVQASSGTITAAAEVRVTAAITSQTLRLRTSLPIGSLFVSNAQNPTVQLLSTTTVLSNVTFDGVNSGSLSLNGQKLRLQGNWVNNRATNVITTVGTVEFNGTSSQQLGGTFATTFDTLHINNATGVTHTNPTTINAWLVLQAGRFTMGTHNIILGTNAFVYSDFAGNQNFANDNFLLNNVGLTGGLVVRQFTAGVIPVTTFLNIPVGTAAGATPIEVRLLQNKITFGANAELRFRPIASVHPQTEVSNLSLTKYWQLTTQNTTVDIQGATVRLRYLQSEVQGNENIYKALHYDGTTWRVGPGASSVVYADSNLAESELVSFLDGDWTAGEEGAVRAIYYSIANGNYSDATTWSKVSYTGPVSPTAPNKNTDRVLIGNNRIVTLTANTPNTITTRANAIIVDTNGTLRTENFIVFSDTLRMNAGGRLFIGSTDGISVSGATGSVQSIVRDYNQNAIYGFSGNLNQVTGPGFPLVVRGLVVTKTGGVVTQSNNISIRDSLVINSGTISTNNFTIDGENPGRTLIMRGGSFRIFNAFPLNYTPPTFTAGEIIFDGTGSTVMPSDQVNGPVPAVLQYNDVTFVGNRQYSTMEFSPIGKINIGGNLSITGITFTNFPLERFNTAGTTFNFNGSGNQNIPRNCGTNQSWARFNYFNLEISGSGTKSFIDANPIINNNVILTSANLALNGFNATVRGNWSNTAGNFTPGTNIVTFEVVNASTVRTAQTRGIPFFDVVIAGLGELQHTDNMVINDDLTINANAIFASEAVGGDTVFLRRNLVYNGTFIPRSGTFVFDSSLAKTITTSGTVPFNNLVMNTSNVVTLGASANSAISVENRLEFINGRINTRGAATRFVAVLGSMVRSGTGHVDGDLRFQIPTGPGTYVYPIGNGTNYTPATVAITGSGGVAGLYEIISNTRTISLTGSTLNTAQNVERQWETAVPSGSTFDLQARTANLTFEFLNPADIRGGANPLQFETRRNTGGTWFVTSTGTRTSTTTQSTNYFNTVFNASSTFVVGPPGTLAFYSIADGNFNAASTWSTEGYGGAVSTIAPSGTAKVYIGDGKTVTMTANYATTAATDTVFVEAAGPSGLGGLLRTQTFLLTGAGVFSLNSGGRLDVGNTAGITTSGASGAIQTTTRNYNPGTHNNGNFIFSGTAAQVTGNGLPSTMRTFTANNSNTVTLTASITTTDSLHIAQGTLALGTNNVTVGGNWRNAGTFAEGAQMLTLNGTGNQNFFNSSDSTFNNITISKVSGVVNVTGSLGVSVAGTLLFAAGNNGIINIKNINRPVFAATVTRTGNGHIHGELQKQIATGASTTAFEVGGPTSLQYTPASIAITGTGGTAGRLGVFSLDSNQSTYSADLTHNLDTTRNIRRYWRVLPRTTFALGGSRTYGLTVTFLNPEDIRGGANTANFVTKRWFSGTWNNTTTGTRTATTTQSTGNTLFGEFMVGESAPYARIFYTRQNGAWSNPSTWSEINYGAAASTAFPRLSTDIVFIGNGNSITLDSNRTLQSVTVESVSGQGTLTFGSNILTGNQFVLNSGGKIVIGSTAGITTSGASGNVQTTIRSYNPFSHNAGKFEYTGTAAQATGNGLPTTVTSLEFSNTNTVTLGSSVTVSDSLIIKNGTVAAGANTITLNGQWVNNSSNTAFTSGTSTVVFSDSLSQNIAGNFNTTFNNVTINKTANNVTLQRNIQINGVLNFNSNTFLIQNNRDITFGSTSSVTGTPSTDKKIVVSGLTSEGTITKQYPNGTSTQNFVFPIGTTSTFLPITLNLTATFATGSASVKMISAQHPTKLSTNSLSRYWTVSSTGISTITSSSLQFPYLLSDVNGIQSQYIPARNTAGVWDINVGTSRSANPSPISVTNELNQINGDWTAGLGNVFVAGRVFYSINSGTWTTPNVWSNISHSGAATAYPPASFSDFDTVYVSSAHTIAFNTATGSRTTIDTLSLAGNFNFTRGTNKTLIVRNGVHVRSTGTINETGTGNRNDSLILFSNIRNDNTTTDAVDLRQDAARVTNLVFTGTENSVISGVGNWRLASVNFNKTNRLDTVVNTSNTFSAALTSRVLVEDLFALRGGIYRKSNSRGDTLDRQGGALVFTMGPNSGIHLQNGTIDFLDNLHTGISNSIRIETGNLRVGGSQNDRNFLYQDELDFVVTGGEMNVRSAFDAFDNNARIYFNLSGTGIVRCVIGTNATNPPYRIGFGIGHPFSTYTQSGGTVVISNISINRDYTVSANTVNVTGGTLQIGEVGIPFNYGSTGVIALTNQRESIYNLRVRQTVGATGEADMRCVIIESGTNGLSVINDVIIDTLGCLDLNTNTLLFGGNFINRGRFTPDGYFWNNGAGPRKLIFNGTGDQLYRNERVQATTPNNSIRQNEAMFDFVLNKPSGNVIIDNTPNSDVIIRNSLIFEPNNKARLIGRTNNRNTVVIPQAAGDIGDVQRIGVGHVDGLLRQNIGTNAQIHTFHIGADTFYTPATLDVKGTGGTLGFVEATAFGVNHPNINANGIKIDTSKNVQRYWSINPGGTFALGTRTFDLNLQFYNPEDIRNGAAPLAFRMARVNVTPPWSSLTVGARTTTTNQSINNTIFGDFVISIQGLIQYFSRANGPWSSPSSWSLVGYGGPPAPDFPRTLFDEALIGNGNTITITDSAHTVGGVKVEKSGTGLFGTLLTNDYFINGLDFEMSDSTTIGTRHPNGFRALGQNTGGIRTTVTRKYAYANYLFDGASTQTTGNGLPDTVLSITNNNTGVVGTNSLQLSKSVTVTDNLNLRRGFFEPGNFTVGIGKDLLIDTLAGFTGGNSTVVLTGTGNQNIINNSIIDTVDFNNLVLKNTGTVITITGSSPIGIVLVDSLVFDPSNTAYIDVRTNGKKLKVSSGGAVVKVGSGHVDGELCKPALASSQVIAFEVGLGSIYSPMLLTTDNTAGNGTAGYLCGGVFGPVPNEPFVGNRLDSSKKINQYWRIDPIDGYTQGLRTSNVEFQFPPAFLSGLNLAKTVIRRRSIPTEIPLWSERTALDFNVGTATVDLNLPTASWWPGLGEFYIGEKIARVFYSRSTGLWQDSSTWSFFGHPGISVPNGEFPNFDWNAGVLETEKNDSVIIGANHIITLGNTIQPELAKLQVDSTGKLIVQNGSFVSQSSTAGAQSYFILRNGAWLTNNTALGIETGLNGLIRVIDSNRIFEPRANYEFAGTVPSQTLGGAFPLAIARLLINKDTCGHTVSINRSGIVASNKVEVDRGILALSSTDAASNPANQTFTMNGALEIENCGIFTASTSGPGPRNHTVNFNGDSIVNNGQFLMLPNLTNDTYRSQLIFGSSTNQFINGTGLQQFNSVVLNKTTPSSTVNNAVRTFISNVTSGNTITFTNGTFNQTNDTLIFDRGLTNAFDQTVTQNGQLHATGNGNIVVGVGGTGGSLVADGGRVYMNTNGSITVGSSCDDNFIYTSTANNRLELEKGLMTIAGRISNITTGDLQFKQDSSTLIVGGICHTSTTKGVFDLTAGSTFATTGGSIILRNRTSTPGSTVADFIMVANPSNINVTGGTINFGDASTPANTIFDYNVNGGPSAEQAFWNITIANTQQLRPFDANQNLRLQGNLTLNGKFNNVILRNGSTATNAAITLQGNNATNQNVTGLDSIITRQMIMNRQGTDTIGKVYFYNTSDIVILDFLDLQEGTNPNRQVLALGQNVDMYIRNNTPGTSGAIRDVIYGSYPISNGILRAIQTSQTSGSLYLGYANGPNGNYTFPIADSLYYMPVRVTRRDKIGSVNGLLGMRVSEGQGANQEHLYMPSTVQHYMKRYWSVTLAEGLSSRGRFEFNYPEGEFVGLESSANSISRWRAPFEGPPGSWLKYGPGDGSFIQTTDNRFTTKDSASSFGDDLNNLWGDWVIGNFNRLFFSRQTGPWEDPNTWTFSPTHSGPIVGAGQFPNDPTDSVIVGGGTNGVNNHIVTLNDSTTVSGVLVGTNSTNTGTLNTRTFVIKGNSFEVRDNSTLGIGSSVGINTIGLPIGNIQTTGVRSFSKLANYDYTGNTNQQFGNALPDSVRGLYITNVGPFGNNTVTSNVNTIVRDSLSIRKGRLNLLTFTSNAYGPSAGFSILDSAFLRIEGTNNMNTALSGFGTYFLGLESFVEFFGTNQTVSPAPNLGVGYGNVVTSQSGTKQVAAPVLIRRNLVNENGSFLKVQPGVEALTIEGSIINSAPVDNEGTIEIGL